MHHMCLGLHAFLSSADFFEKFFQEYHHSVKQFGPRLGPTVRKGYQQTTVYSFSASAAFYCLLINFANSLDPDQAQL